MKQMYMDVACWIKQELLITKFGRGGGDIAIYMLNVLDGYFNTYDNAYICKLI